MSDTTKKSMGPGEYIETKYGTKAFARCLILQDAPSIMDLMQDYASFYANQMLDEASKQTKKKYVELNSYLIQKLIEGESQIICDEILNLKDKI